MTEQELQWLKDLYEYYVFPGRAAKTVALHCDHWTKILFMELKSKREKTILTNDQHAVLSIDGVYIDLEFNAFIVDFDWPTRGIDSTVQYKPIHPNYAVLRDQIFKYYSSPAKQGFHLWTSEVFNK